MSVFPRRRNEAGLQTVFGPLGAEAAGRPRTWVRAVAVLTLAATALLLALLWRFVRVGAEVGLAGGAGGERQLFWLFWANTVVAALLGGVLLWAAWRLARRLRQRKFGSRLLMKLAVILGLVGLLPGLLIYSVSYQFATRSIAAWFDTRVAGALDAGLSLGKLALDDWRQQTEAAARGAAAEISRVQGAGEATLLMERLRSQLRADELVWLTQAGEPLRSVGSNPLALRSSAVPTGLLRQARERGSVSQIEGLDDGDAEAARVVAVVRAPDANVGSPAHYLMVVRHLPQALVTQALQVQTAYSEYQERALARSALKRLYIGTLTLALVLAVFGGVLLAVVLGNQIARPLLLLAEGVREVAAGNLAARPVSASSDELGGLTRAFAAMTRQVADARDEVRRGVVQLEGARTQLQTILDNLSAGVVVLDPDGRIATVNPAATRLLREPLKSWRGRPMTELPGGLAPLAAQWLAQFGLLEEARSDEGRESWQESFELRSGTPQAVTLLARGALLPDGARLLVFDDITEVVSAERSAAWSEVARRVAHEIKNPLTPIQLSAERLEHRLASRLEEPERAMLSRSVATIVTQVQAMKTLVNEFRDFARMPAAELKPVSLNAVVQEVLALYAHEVDTGRVRAELAPDLPSVMGDATQLRQVIHNLLQNALDAVHDRLDGRVVLRTEAERETAAAVASSGMGGNTAAGELTALGGPGGAAGGALGGTPAGTPGGVPSGAELRSDSARARAGAASGTSAAAQAISGGPTSTNPVRAVKLSVTDNGPGFAAGVLQRAFEPYLTTKSKGTGLGLSVVKKIVDEHRAKIRLRNVPAEAVAGQSAHVAAGARVSISFSLLQNNSEGTPPPAV